VGSRVLGGRRVRRVRVEEVHPDEKRPGSVLIDPGERRAHHLVGRALHPRGRSQEIVVVAVEAAREASGRAKRVPADERRRLIPSAPQRLGERRNAGTELEPVVRAHAVMGRVESCENRGVGGQGERRLRDGGAEHRGAGREAIGRGRQAARRAVRAEPIGAQRIDRDQHDRPRRNERRAGRAVRLGPAAGEHDHQHAERSRAPHAVSVLD